MIDRGIFCELDTRRVDRGRRRSSAWIGAFLLTLWVVSPAPIQAEDGHGGLTLEQVSRLRSVEEIAISPDGKHVAYALDVPRRPMEDEDGPAWREIHVVDVESGETRPFVTGIRISDLAWKPGAGSPQISFLAKREGDESKSLYLISLAGGEARKVLSLDEDIQTYRWSSDGGHVAVLAKEPETKEAKELTEKGFTQNVVDEQARMAKIWIAGTEDYETRELDLEGYARGLEWSPAGDRLAVKVSPGAGPDDGLVATTVRIVGVESGDVLGKIDNPGKLGDLAWSPDGAHLAMISAEDPSDPREGRLMVAGKDGGELVDLLPGLEAHVLRMVWRDDEHLIFLVAEGVETWLGEIDASGSGRRTLIEGGHGVWERIHRADGGALALIGSTPEHPSEAFVWSGEGAPRKLTDSNPWLADVRLAKQEPVRWTARDGLELEGLLIRPLDEQAGQRYPLIMVVHGGPEAHYSNGWITGYSQPGQTGAARGFAVFYPNYRASTGRGVAFSKLDHKDLAGKEFDDLVDGVDHLIEIGLVDRDKVGVTGASYGGYATGWCSTYYSERFAAGVMFVGISNNTSKLGTSDIPVELYQVHSRKWPWTDWDFFLERSPIRYVEKARTPLLIAAGEEDPRVHPSQSLQLYRYLKLLGNAPVRLVLYPGEEHGNRRAASRWDYSLRQMRWLEHYLKGPGGEPPPADVAYDMGAN